MSTSAPIPQSQLLPLPLQQLLLPENAKIPPTDIKETIDKSVIYILKNGKSFEERLLKNNRNKHFNFLQP
ncbi:SURP domain-containing protein, partial [Acetobacter pasteurianus]|nr:SURP domain-containing protein [Acetobacter pasteurianus]